MKTWLSIVLLFFSSTLAFAESGPLIEPAGNDEAVVVLSITIPRIMSLDTGPTAAYLIRTEPTLGQAKILGRSGSLLYLGNLKVGNTYRLFRYTNTVYDGKVDVVYNFDQGIAGNDELTFTVDKPGVIYLGAFTHTKEGLVYDGKNEERKWLNSLMVNLDQKSTWKALIKARIKELTK